MGALTTLNSKGQLTFPKEIRAALDIAPGTESCTSVQNRKLLATPATAGMPKGKKFEGRR